MIIGVISDTHIPSRARSLPASVFKAFEGVDLILHAGDFIEHSVLEELQAFAPTHGVLGNMDEWSLRASVPERTRMRRAFSNSRVVVFGHSHQPLIQGDGGLLLLNPGSACDPRRARVPTVAILTIEGETPKAEIIEI